MAHFAEKLSQELQQRAALFLQRESNGQSLITVTRCDLTDNQKYATIFISVLPVEKEDTAIEFVRRQRRDFLEYIRKETKIGRLPTINFELDMGEKNRQRIDELSAGKE
jgi:ribosome-binding factor A